MLRRRRDVCGVRPSIGARRAGARALAAIAAEPIIDVDTTAAEVLARLGDEVTVRGIRAVFAEMRSR
ncbi:hypothetical protein HC251_18675 [Iamia sp. SCSIO 61187]|uniref:hypothetical protein n=1 Tax=Iamia sp. SCSIO 61187 TaxID=2722752 RepID=UPI001C636A1D|nr:hypothetical protein [Iamia sp. SCSIO 61187]QYG94261.1 hypothetical protein HC251_18675 [Iamia sp. SCSIO 61187]